MDFISHARLSLLPIKEINESLPTKGLVYEVGSGYGVLAARLAHTYTNRNVVGIDIDSRKISIARKSFHYDNLTFVQGDVLQFSFKKYNGVVLSDFLHHISYNDQNKLLFILKNKIKSKGVLIIKEIDNKDTVRKNFSRLWDFLLYPKDTIYYRSKVELAQYISDLGFNVSVVKRVSWFPGSTNLFICTKRD